MFAYNNNTQHIINIMYSYFGHSTIQFASVSHGVLAGTVALIAIIIAAAAVASKHHKGKPAVARLVSCSVMTCLHLPSCQTSELGTTVNSKHKCMHRIAC